MALDTYAVVEAGIEDVFDSLQLGQVTFSDATRGKNALMEVQSAFISMYRPSHRITVTASQDANVAAFLASGGQGEDISLNDVFETLGTGDVAGATTFATVKGGALAAGDRWQKITASTVKYLGNGDFTFTGETDSDW